MDLRRKAAFRVVVEGASVSVVALELGLSRPTVRLWAARARVSGIAELAEESRRPLKVRDGADAAVVEAIINLKAQRPAWGGKKLVAVLWPQDPPICVRTADRILARNGLVSRRKATAPFVRFERQRCNELWQMDFKGLGSPRLGYSPLSLVDDHSRFCLAFEPVAGHTVEDVWPVLWALLGRYGLPETILTDNEPCFHTSFGYGPSHIEARLWRLGIRTTQCRPGHPQTQGKVERFHRTVSDELGDSLRQPDIASAQTHYPPFVNRYNWERPHESIGMRVPGAVYVASLRPRPAMLPQHQPLGERRIVDASGKFCYRGGKYRAGHGLTGETVDIRPAGVFYANVLFSSLENLKV